MISFHDGWLPEVEALAGAAALVVFAFVALFEIPVVVAFFAAAVGLVLVVLVVVVVAAIVQMRYEDLNGAEKAVV